MKLWRYGRTIERLGQRYRLEGALGSGGMADVCLAWDEHEAREVAIKVIKPDVLDQRSLDRFLKEAAQIAQWQHPNILHIYSDLKLELLDATQGAIVPYIVMEYAQGGDLQKRLTPGQPYPLAATLDIFSQLCSAVAYAHQHGVIHRDLKPLNILFRTTSIPPSTTSSHALSTTPTHETEEMVLSDFGLAVEMDATHHTFARGGTLPYMAPEQLQGKVQAASDIFALGVILYQLCTGRLPFRRRLQDLWRADAFALPATPSTLAPNLPGVLDDVILTALNEDPSVRYANADQFWQSIQYAMTSLQATTQPRPPISRSKGYTPSPANPRLTHSTHPPRSSHPRSSINPPAILPAQQNIDAFASITDTPDSSASDISVIPTRRASRFNTTHVSSTDSDLDSYSSNPNPPLRTRSPGPHTPYPTPSSSSSSFASTANPRLRSTRSGTRPKPMPAMPARRPTMTPVPRSLRPHLIVLVSTIVLLTLIAGGSIYFIPAVRTRLGIGAPTITVSITPASKPTQQPLTVPLADVNGQALTSSQPQTKTVQGTGHVQHTATQAQGMLTFFNGAFAAQTVAAGMVLTGKDGVQIVTDANINIPAANSTTGKTSSMTVAAHAVNPAAKGNIAVLDLNFICCTNDGTIFVRNLSAFTGGQDAVTYNFVQQGDVDGVANPIVQALTEQVQGSLRAQVKAGQQLVGGMQCVHNNVIDPKNAVGDTGVNVEATSVTVTVQCSGEAYDQARLQMRAGEQLSVSTAPGVGYQLTNVGVAQVAFGSAGQGGQNVLAFIGRGTWVYQISDALQGQIVRSIAGMSVGVAEQKIRALAPVASVSIQGVGGDGLLPVNVSNIAVVVVVVGG